MNVLGTYKELVLVAALFAWFIARRRASQKWFPWVGALLILEFTVEIVAKLLSSRGINNHLAYNVFFAVEFVVIARLLYINWPEARHLRRVVQVAVAIFLPTLVWDLGSHDSPHYLATNALIIGGLLLGAISAKALFVLARESIVPLHREPLFWVLLSIMVYYLTFIPIFGLYNYLIAQNSPITFQLNYINNVLFVIRYGSVLTGLVMLYRQATPSHDGQ